MHFLVRRPNRTHIDSGHKKYREFRVQTQRLTIGRAPDQHLQIADRSVEPCHAVICLHGPGRLHIKAVTSSCFQINGESRRTAALSTGDLIQIGSALITVEKSQVDHLAIVTINFVAAADEGNLDSLHHTDLSQTRLSKRSWSWVLALSVITFFLLIPLSGIVYPPIRELLRENAFFPDDSLWLSGPLHSSHLFLGKDCNACHTSPFTMVQNQQCVECHIDIQHHVDVTSQDVQIFDQDRCANCHLEHNEPSTLLKQDQRLCTDCHRHLAEQKTDTTLQNVTDFGTDHPEFSLTLRQPRQKYQGTQWVPVRVDRKSPLEIREQSFLTFSHQQHLDSKGIHSPKGDQVLVCQDCHRPNTSGRKMLPITMENHCSGCHSLLFDENDLSSTMVHGDLTRVYDSLKHHFSRKYLESVDQDTHQENIIQARRPGVEARILSRMEQQRALDWANKQSLMIAEELLEDRLCGDCHQVSKVPGKTGFEQWHLEPVALNRTWMPLARFDHASHAIEPCTTCHADAKTSEKSGDVLMPRIKICRECHGGAKDQNALPSDCLMCHQFHLPNRGPFDPTQQTTAGNSAAQQDISNRLATDVK